MTLQQEGNQMRWTHTWYPVVIGLVGTSDLGIPPHFNRPTISIETTTSRSLRQGMIGWPPPPPPPPAPPPLPPPPSRRAAAAAAVIVTDAVADVDAFAVIVLKFNN
jgi:hypothetical protein